MWNKCINFLLLIAIFMFTYSSTASADDYYKSLYSNQIQHQFYFSIPLHGNKVKSKDTPIRLGFRSTFERGSFSHFSFDNSQQRHRNFRANLMNLEFTGTNRAKLELAGLRLGGLNKHGLYAGQDNEQARNPDKKGNGGAAVLGVLLLAAVVVAAVAVDTPTEEECFYSSDSFDEFDRCRPGGSRR